MWLGSGQLQFIDKPSNVKLQDTDAGQSTVTAQWRVLNVQIYAQFQFQAVSNCVHCAVLLSAATSIESRLISLCLIYASPTVADGGDTVNTLDILF